MLHKKDTNHILFFSKSGFKVAELIFNFPTKIFHLRELTRESGKILDKKEISTTAASKWVKELEKYNIIKVKNTPITSQIQADLDSDAYYHYKQIFNLYRINQYNLVSKLDSIFHPKAIVLFGSFAKGEDIEESDIDILIISNVSEWNFDLKPYEKVLARKINLHTLKDLKGASKEFKNEIANGIVLQGFIEVIDRQFDAAPSKTN